MSNWFLVDYKEEVNEATIQYVGVVLDPLKPRISCQDVLLPKAFSMKSKSQSWICSVYYHSKCCMEAEKRKNNISRKEELRERVEHPPKKSKEYSAQEIVDFRLRARERMNPPIT